MPDDKMIEVLVAICVVEMVAKNMHYRSYDELFYALHLLADKVDFGNSADDLKEAYYLGAKEVLPPTEEDIHRRAIERIGDTTGKINRELIEALKDACEMGLYAIEEAKREPGLFAGVHAIVDGVSEKMLVVKGLCYRSLANVGTGDSGSNE